MEVEEKLALKNEKLKKLSNTDFLTGLQNRRKFKESIENECKRCRRKKEPISLILLDIDYFKKFNDLYGHPAGDECLKKVARVLENNVKRPADSAARYGGEEFIALLPETTDNQAAKIAKRMQQAIAKTNLNGLPAGVRITISLGVAEKSSQQCSIEYLVDIADKAMYAAKRQGKNQVALYPL